MNMSKTENLRAEAQYTFLPTVKTNLWGLPYTDVEQVGRVFFTVGAMGMA